MHNLSSYCHMALSSSHLNDSRLKALSPAPFCPWGSNLKILTCSQNIALEQHLAAPPTSSQLSPLSVYKCFFSQLEIHWQLRFPSQLLLLNSTLQESDLLHCIACQSSQPQIFSHIFPKLAIFATPTHCHRTILCIPESSTFSIYFRKYKLKQLQSDLYLFTLEWTEKVSTRESGHTRKACFTFYWLDS